MSQKDGGGGGGGGSGSSNTNALTGKKGRREGKAAPGTSLFLGHLQEVLSPLTSQLSDSFLEKLSQTHPPRGISLIGLYLPSS
ncbi:hypothetical protein STEG23_029232 [Scotinomys teguina]